MCKEVVVSKKELSTDEANEELALLREIELERFMEVVEAAKEEGLREELELPYPRDLVFPNERGPMTFQSIDRKK